MFLKYLKAAFNAKFGMPVPATWMILAFTGVLSYMDWGFGIVGIGGLAAYLYILANSTRFHRFVNGQESLAAQKTSLGKIGEQVMRLSPAERGRYADLVRRCDTIIRQQQHETMPEELKQQATGLSRLAGFYLQLLMSKSAIENMPSDENEPAIKKMMASLQKRITATFSADVSKSLQGQMDILKQRLTAQMDAANRLEYVESELQRIEQQVELLREQTVADTAPRIVSARIDAVTSTLTGTNEWMKQNKDLLGQVDDVFSEPPPILQVLQQQ